VERQLAHRIHRAFGRGKAYRQIVNGQNALLWHGV
jgi:hypothetical protein